MSFLAHNQVLFLTLVLLLIVILFATGIAAILSQKSGSNKRKRALTVIKGEFSRASNKEEKEAKSKRQAALAQKLKDQEEDKEQDKKKKANTIRMLMQRAGLTFTQHHFWMFAVLSGVVVGGVLFLVGFSNIKCLLAALAAFFFIPRIVLNRMAASRQKNFLENFPDALDSVVRLLKAGTPISEAIAMLSKEYTGPIGEEMSTIYDRQKIGVPLYEAATEAVSRIPLPEMNMFATALTIQAQTGSSLSTILSSLSETIRGRFRLKRKVRALAQEAVASAGIIAALPFLVMIGLYFSNKEYIMLLFTDSFGKILFWGAMSWMACGVFVMKQMINMKV